MAFFFKSLSCRSRSIWKLRYLSFLLKKEKKKKKATQDKHILQIILFSATAKSVQRLAFQAFLESQLISSSPCAKFLFYWIQMTKTVQHSQKDLISVLHNSTNLPFLKELSPLRHDETKSAFSRHSIGSATWLRHLLKIFFSVISRAEASSLQQKLTSLYNKVQY